MKDIIEKFKEDTLEEKFIIEILLNNGYIKQSGNTFCKDKHIAHAYSDGIILRNSILPKNSNDYNTGFLKVNSIQLQILINIFVK